MGGCSTLLDRHGSSPLMLLLSAAPLNGLQAVWIGPPHASPSWLGLGAPVGDVGCPLRATRAEVAGANRRSRSVSNVGEWIMRVCTAWQTARGDTARAAERRPALCRLAQHQAACRRTPPPAGRQRPGGHLPRPRHHAAPSVMKGDVRRHHRLWRQRRGTGEGRRRALALQAMAGYSVHSAAVQPTDILAGAMVGSGHG